MIITPEIERFAKDIAFRAPLREELKALGSTDDKVVVDFANKKGYRFSLEDVKELQQSGEISQIQHAGMNDIFIAMNDNSLVVATYMHLLIWHDPVIKPPPPK